MKNNNFEIVKACDICGSKTNKNFITVPDRNYQTGEFAYVKCSKCGLIWLTPRPNSKIIHKYYPQIYPAYQKNPSPSKFQKKLRIVFQRNTWLAKFFIKDQLFFWKQKGRLLDVGTGNGSSVALYSRWGWQAEGLELNAQAVKVARKNNIPVKHGTLFTANFPNESFDVVRFSHVLEHVPSPRAELIETGRILKKEGSVIIYVPNIRSLSYKIFRSYWYLFEPPRHFFHFTPLTITALLEKTHYKNIKIKYIQSPHPIWWSIQYLRGIQHVNKKLNILRYPAGKLLSAVNLFHLSDVIEVTAQKRYKSKSL